MSDDNGDAVDEVMAKVRDIGMNEIAQPEKFAEWEAAVRVAVERAIRQASVPQNDDSMEVYILHGAIQKNDGENWTEEEGEAFSDCFLGWLEEQGLGYGGLLGEPKPLERQRGGAKEDE